MENLLNANWWTVACLAAIAAAGWRVGDELTKAVWGVVYDAVVAVVGRLKLKT